jgi:hypothetical protein
VSLKWAGRDTSLEFRSTKVTAQEAVVKKGRRANKELAARSVAREKLGSLGKEITQIDPRMTKTWL